MTRTTRPATTRPDPAPYKAPRYRKLEREQLDKLDGDELARHDLHAAIDTISDALNHARTDRDAHGWPADLSNNDSPPSTDTDALNAVETWSLRADVAGKWLAEQAEAAAAIRRVARLAISAGYHTLPTGTVSSGVTVGESDEIPRCAWCGQQARPGRNPETGRTLIHKVGDFTLHAKSDVDHPSCYDQACWQARKTSVSLAAVLAARHSNTPTAVAHG